MPVTYTERLSQSVTVGFPSSNPAVTSSFTPGAGERLLVIVGGQEQLSQTDANFPNSWTITDTQSLTWTSLGTVGNGTSKAIGMAAWISTPAAASSMTISIDCSFFMFISNEIKVLGCLSAGTSITGFVKSTSTATDGGYTDTLTAAPASSDLTIFARYLDADAGTGLSMDTGWTVLSEIDGLTGNPLGIATRTASTSTSVIVVDTQVSAQTVRKGVDFTFTVPFVSSTNWTATVTDSLGLTDAAVQAAVYAPAISDLVGSSDGLSPAAAYAPTITDLLGSSDALGQVATYAPVLADTVGTTDTLVQARDLVQVLADSLGSTDAVTFSDVTGVAPSLRPTTELVAVAWLRGITGISPGMVATQLPQNVDSWKATGFVTVRVVGGAPSMYTPLRQPVLAVDGWAVNPTSNKPPWFQANALMELIDQGCRASNAGRWLTLPDLYLQARVTTAYWVTEPQRVYSDQGGYARYTANLQLNWVPAVSN